MGRCWCRGDPLRDPRTPSPRILAFLVLAFGLGVYAGVGYPWIGALILGPPLAFLLAMEAFERRDVEA